MPPSELVDVNIAESATSVPVKYGMGWWNKDDSLVASAIRSLVTQTRQYIANGHGASSDGPFILFGQSGQATLGIYIGHGLLNQGIGSTALRTFQGLGILHPARGEWRQPGGGHHDQFRPVEIFRLHSRRCRESL